MKNLLVAIILALGLVASVFAGDYFEGTPQNLYPAGTTTSQLFSNYSTVGVSSTIINTKFLPDQATWEIVHVGGTPSAFNISIDGSIRCVEGSFYSLSEITQADTIKMKHMALKAVPCVRATINSKTGGGAFNLWMLMRGQ